MKTVAKVLITAALIGLVFWLHGCGSSEIESRYQKTEGEVIFRAVDVQVYKFWYEGRMYLVASRGGIIEIKN